MNHHGSSAGRVFAGAVLAVAIAFGVSALVSGPVSAKPKRPPGPLCGPDILWECTFKDGSTERVGATRCEIEKFEKKNKATCKPAMV